MKSSLLFAISMAGVSGVATAQTERDLDSHAHGLATMNVAIADSNVFLELETPWDNLVGFEHKPSTDEQHAMVDNALESLRQASSVVVLNGGNCELHEVHIEDTMGSDDHDDHDDHKEHDDHYDHDDHKEHDDHDDHDDHKDHDDHDDHDDHKEHDDHDDHDDHKEHDDHDDHDDHKDHDDHDHADHEGEDTHSSLLVSYEYKCEDVSSLSDIEVAAFSSWENFESISVQMIGPGGQSAVELTPRNTFINLDSVK